MTTQIEKVISEKDIPFEIEKKDSSIEVMLKIPKHISRDKRKSFKSNRTSVEIHLFDVEDIRNLQALEIDVSKKRFSFRNTYIHLKNNTWRFDK